MQSSFGARRRATEDTRITVVNGMVALALIALFLIAFGGTGIEPSSFVSLKELDMSADVTRANGETDHYDDGVFETLIRGERAELHIILPETTQGTEAFFPFYSAVVNMYIDGVTLFEDSYDPNDLAAHYGNRIYEVPLPQGSAGRELTVEFTAVQTTGFSELDGWGLVQANEGWKSILKNRTSVFVIFLTLITLALLGAVYCAVMSIVQRRLLMGLPIALFELFLIAWFIGMQHMFYLLFGNAEFCAKAEYYALYLVPLALTLFIYQVVDVRGFKRMILVLILVYLVFYVTTTVIELTTIQLNYSDMLLVMHPLAALIFILLVISLFAGVKGDSDGHVFILRYGTIFAVACGIAELVRHNVVKYTVIDGLFSLNGLSIFAILTIMSFTVAVVLYLIVRGRAEFASRIEHAQLEDLAYRDILTGLANRAGFHRDVSRMIADGVRGYTMVFIDLNDLKRANDQFGHKTGDELLTFLGKTVEETFAKSGFCARWGGDEFVACVYGSAAKGAQLLSALEGKLDEANAEGRFPFKVSVACGMASSSNENYLDPNEAVRIADSFMYENKKRAKEAELL